MKRFRFPLRPVAVLRAHRELRAREAFANAVHAYVAAEAELAAVRERVQRFEASLFAGRRGSFNAAEEAQSLSAYRRECAAETEAERVAIAARDEMNQRRSAYLDAHREHEVVKNLEHRARTAHVLAASREEQAELDELAGRRARRQQLAHAS